MKMLVAVDFSEHTKAMVEEAVGLLRGALGAVWLLHVAEPNPDFVGYGIEPAAMRDSLAQAFHREHQQLQALADALRSQGIAATALLIQGETAKSIVQQAAKLDVDVIVIGANTHGPLYQLLAGEVNQADLLAAGRPVLVMPLRKGGGLGG